MLELYFKYPRVLRRLRDGELGGEMDRIAGYISEAGYKRESAKIYLSWLGRFSDHLWHAARNTPINQAVIDALVDAYPTKAPRLAARTAIELARKVVPERFAIPCVEPDPHQPFLDAYMDHLRQVRGIAPKTCEGLHLAASRILGWCDARFPKHLLAMSFNHQTRTLITSNLRMFLRYLRWSGLNNQDLARFVPHTPRYRLAHLPPRLAWADVRRAIDALDVTTSVGIRNRAILLLVATTGLRNKELRSLELHDIRWRSAEVIVRQTKSRRDRVVPLLQEAGEALADYVLHAQPKSGSQRVFLQHLPPVRPIEGGSIIFQDRARCAGAGRHRASPGRRRSSDTP